MACNSEKDKRPVCKQCNLVVADQMILESHMLTCFRQEQGPQQKGASFSPMWKGNSASGTAVGNPTHANEENGEKFEPLSQDLEPLTQTISIADTSSYSHACSGCNRSFQTARGLGRHKASCTKKKNEETRDPPQQGGPQT